MNPGPHRSTLGSTCSLARNHAEGPQRDPAAQARVLHGHGLAGERLLPGPDHHLGQRVGTVLPALQLSGDGESSTERVGGSPMCGTFLESIVARPATRMPCISLPGCGCTEHKCLPPPRASNSETHLVIEVLPLARLQRGLGIGGVAQLEENHLDGGGRNGARLGVHQDLPAQMVGQEAVTQLQQHEGIVM